MKEISEHHLFFIKRNNALVGTAAYKTRPDGSVYIGSVATSPEYRRQGIARAAMHFILDKVRGTPRIDLVTHPENEKSLALYASLGFVVESRKENYWGDGEPRLVLVLKKLSPS